MQTRINITHIFILFVFVLIIPFFEFINVNFHKIDIVVYKQLLIYFILIVLFFSSIILLLYFYFKDKYKLLDFVLIISFFYFLIFKYEIIKQEIGYYFILHTSSEKSPPSLAIISIFLGILIFTYFIKNKMISKIFNSFYKIFIYIQILILLFNLSILIKKNFWGDNFEKNKFISSKLYFTEQELKKIHDSSNNRNIYFIIMDGMASIEQYENLLNHYNLLSSEIIETLEDYRNFFNRNDLFYIKNSFSTFKDTHHTIGSIFNLEPLKIDHLKKESIEYQSMLYPSILSKNNFEINNYPNLIINLNAMNYEFKWVGYKLDCKFVNPNLCYDYNLNNNSKNFFINFYILKSFLVNTPAIELYSFVRNNLNFKPQLPDRGKIINEKNQDLKSRNEVLTNFMRDMNNYTINNKSYFYFIHNILPSDPFIFDKHCNFKKDIITKNKEIIAYHYSQNYLCALKKIKEFVEHINDFDPEAIIIFQADHGQKIINYNINDEYKIFNLIKVPKNCKKYLSNEIDSVNASRLALSCATNTSTKLLKRKLYKEKL